MDPTDIILSYSCLSDKNGKCGEIISGNHFFESLFSFYLMKELISIDWKGKVPTRLSVLIDRI
jgi:hypothetical protein